jgi:hypothetical protein
LNNGAVSSGDAATGVKEGLMRRIVYASFVLLCLVPSLASAQGRLPADQIDLSQVHVYNSPADVASWPVTTAITQLNMRPTGDPLAGVSLVFSGQQTWPDYWPPGWDGPLQYTVWAVWYAAGQWNAAGIIQMWRSRASTGAPILTDFGKNWIYDSRWGPGWGHYPVVGERMGFFVTAGNARGVYTVTSVRERSNVVMVSLPAGDFANFSFPSTARPSATDFDGDGKADIAVYRPGAGQWWITESGTQSTMGVAWGTSGDIPLSGDFDGDGKSDIAVYRPSTGGWFILESSTNFQASIVRQWGTAGDIPAPGDYDGDGKTDMVVFRPSTGGWFGLLSSTNFTSSATFVWGTNGDRPVPGDYDGDGITDVGVYRPSTGVWYLMKSTTRYASWLTYQWGAIGDVPVPGDYDGDGVTDIAVYRPMTGGWYILKSSSNFTTWLAYQWGTTGDVPVPGDFDGDGKTDLAVFRPSTGSWLILLSSTGNTGYSYSQWGVSTDLPVGLNVR